MGFSVALFPRTYCNWDPIYSTAELLSICLKALMNRRYNPLDTLARILYQTRSLYDCYYCHITFRITFRILIFNILVIIDNSRTVIVYPNRVNLSPFFFYDAVYTVTNSYQRNPYLKYKIKLFVFHTLMPLPYNCFLLNHWI